MPQDYVAIKTFVKCDPLLVNNVYILALNTDLKLFTQIVKFEGRHDKQFFLSKKTKDEIHCETFIPDGFLIPSF